MSDPYCTVTVATAPATGRACMAGSSAPPFEMARVDCPLPLAMKVGDTVPCPEMPVAPGGRVAVICKRAGRIVVAMHQRYRLAVLRKQAPVGNIHHLQDLGVVTDLQRHGIYILRPPRRTLTAKVEPGACVRLAGSNTKLAEPAAICDADCVAGVGIGPCAVAGATPRNDLDIFTERTPEDRIREQFADVDADVVVCGHTHTQFERTIAGIRVVNSGSVGMPYEDAPGAYWTLDLEHRRTDYEPDPPLELPGREEAIAYLESRAVGRVE